MYDGTPPTAVLVGRTASRGHWLQRATGRSGGRRSVRQAGSRCTQTVHRRRQRAPDRRCAELLADNARSRELGPEGRFSSGHRSDLCDPRGLRCGGQAGRDIGCGGGRPEDLRQRSGPALEGASRPRDAARRLRPRTCRSRVETSSARARLPARAHSPGLPYDIPVAGGECGPGRHRTYSARRHATGVRAGKGERL
jgi:hypothetical protein